LGKSYLSEQSFEQVFSKLIGKNTITPQELEHLEIFSASCAIDYYRNGSLKGEQHGKRVFIFKVEDVLDLISKIFIKKEEKEKKNKQKELEFNKQEFIFIKKDKWNKILELFTELDNLITESKDVK